MNTRGVPANPANSVPLRTGSLASNAISADLRRRPADKVDERRPTQTPLSLDSSNPLGCHYHKVCPSRGPIGYCDFRSLEPMTVPFGCTCERDDGDHL